MKRDVLFAARADQVREKKKKGSQYQLASVRPVSKTRLSVDSGQGDKTKDKKTESRSPLRRA